MPHFVEWGISSLGHRALGLSPEELPCLGEAMLSAVFPQVAGKTGTSQTPHSPSQGVWARPTHFRSRTTPTTPAAPVAVTLPLHEHPVPAALTAIAIAQASGQRRHAQT